MSSLYNGSSEGTKDILDGYIDYSLEVIKARAVPDLRDGQKPVTRRIIYKAKEKDRGRLIGVSGFVTAAMDIHPHGDSSVYRALCLLTDENGSCNVPFFHGEGNYGKVYLSDKPADMRYPLAKINENIEDFFVDSEAMELVKSEKEDLEPTVLMARYPIVLVNGASGIAVSASTEMAPFNLGDVLDLTCKYLKNGDLTIEDSIAPDFPTGGILVQDDQEIAKIMLTGKGKLKVRARVIIDGKKIYVQEVPYGKTAGGIVKTINNANLSTISKCWESTGRNAPGVVSILCKSKRAVEETLVTLYRMNILQNVFSSNTLVVNDGEPEILGVFKIIKKWVTWRESVLKTKFNKLLEGIQPTKERLSFFIRLVENDEWKDEYVRRWTKVGKQSCHDYLDEIFAGENISIETKDWIHDRRGAAFLNGGKYRTQYEGVLNSIEIWKGYLNDLDSYIYNELQEIKKQKVSAGLCNRKTELTYQDYKFSKISDSTVVKDTSFCIYGMRDDGFLMKVRSQYDLPKTGLMYTIEGNASSVLLGFDNFGRILRVIGEEIPFTKEGEKGVYLPKYFGGDFEESYRVLYLCMLDGSMKTLVYRDGYIGFLDTAEFVDKRNTKIVTNGVCMAVMDKLLEVYDEKDVSEYLLLGEDDKGYVRLGAVRLSTVPVRSRLSRAKVFSGTDINACYLKGFKYFDLVRYISEADEYIGKFKRFKGEFYGDPEELADGTYLEICKDLE